MNRTASLGTAQGGFTLIEVLIAALILSVGLLGLAGLQTVSLRMNHGANIRTQATNLAYEITDSMRANRNNAADYAGTYDAIDCDKEYSRENDVVSDDDISEWRNRLACLLPDGRGSITVDVNGGRIEAQVTITWNEALRLDGDEDQSFGFATEL